jgi:hypothetical protein
MRTLLRLMTLGLVAAGAGCASWEPLVDGYGLGHVINPLHKPDGVVCYSGGPDPAGKDHVHTFVINGADPLCVGNLDGMCDYFRDQGFTHTHFVQPYTRYWLPDGIKEVREKDPQAKIVVMGFSWGCNDARSLANRLYKEGVQVDLLVYLASDLIWNTRDSFTPNVNRVVNVRGYGLILLGTFANGDELDGARNEKVSCRHIEVPSRQHTLEVLSEELNALAAGPAAQAQLPTSATSPISHR